MADRQKEVALRACSGRERPPWHLIHTRLEPRTRPGSNRPAHLPPTQCTAMSLLALRRATASSASTCSAKAFSRSAAFGLGRPAFASTQRLFGQPRPARHNSHPGAIHTQTARESSWLAGPSSNYAGGTGLVGPDPGCHDEDAGGSHQGKAAGDQKQRGTGDEQQSLFVAGIGRRVTGGDEQKVIDLFQGVANVLSVRMGACRSSSVFMPSTTENNV